MTPTPEENVGRWLCRLNDLRRAWYVTQARGTVSRADIAAMAEPDQWAILAALFVVDADDVASVDIERYARTQLGDFEELNYSEFRIYGMAYGTAFTIEGEALYGSTPWVWVHDFVDAPQQYDPSLMDQKAIQWWAERFMQAGKLQ